MFDTLADSQIQDNVAEVSTGLIKGSFHYESFPFLPSVLPSNSSRVLPMNEEFIESFLRPPRAMGTSVMSSFRPDAAQMARQLVFVLSFQKLEGRAVEER